MRLRQLLGRGRAQYGGEQPTISCDDNGNLIHYKEWNNRYDAQNRLTKAWNGTTTAQFYYDGKNRQIARNVNGVIRFSAWDGWELLEEYSSSLNVVTGYLQGTTGVIKSWSAANTLYYYQDKLGSTTHVVNASGQLVESYHYDLYGTPSYFNSTFQPINSSTVGVADLYAGERWIPELALYDLRNRFMSPELGRFLQQDPIGFKGDASNLYRYCGNDPVDGSDPLGLLEFEIQGDATFQQQIRNFIATIDSKSAGHAYLNELRASPFRQVFVPGPTNQTRALTGPDSMNGKGAGSTYEINPAQKDSGKDSTGNTQRPGFIGVAHETVGHGIENARGQHVPKALDNSIDRIPKSEKAAIQRENEVRKEHSIPERVDFYKKWP
jgi:RHS repeat-associated protein